MTRLRKLKIQIPAPRCTIYVAIGSPESAKRWFRKCSINVGEHDSTDLAYTVLDKNSRRIGVWLSDVIMDSALSISTVGHEAVHVSYDIQRLYGKLFNKTIDEFQAYFVDYFLQEVLKKVGFRA